MSVNASTEATAALTFCKEYVELAGDLAGIGKAFIIAALALGIAYAAVETIRKYREAPALRARALPNTGAIKELIEALKGFLEALAKAPAWIAMFGAGVLLFWTVGLAIPDKCLPELNKAYRAGGADTSGDRAPGNQQEPVNTTTTASQNASAGNSAAAK